MSMKYLGETFDIHGGGLDNQFPHHECEIAQSECATGKPFVKYWIHNNLVTVNGQKMSKSLGNFVTLKDAFAKFDPLVVRFFILQSHYRSTLDFSDAALEGARVGWEKLVGTMQNVREGAGVGGSGTPPLNLDAYRSRFLEAMNDDFNTPKAIAVLFDASKEVNQLIHADKRPSAAALTGVETFFNELGGDILGIFPEQAPLVKATDGQEVPALMQILLDVREEVRKQKLWPLSDLVRDRLKALGIAIDDKKEGSTWKRTRI
jgi:cysteinyl-tRNA synthetase